MTLLDTLFGLRTFPGGFVTKRAFPPTPFLRL